MPRIENVKVNDLHAEGPIYQPLVDALVRGDKPEERLFAVGDLQIAPKFWAPEEHVGLMLLNFENVKRTGEEFYHHVLVMERSDGSLWVYDDCAYVEAAQRLNPALVVSCGVYKDPTR